MKVILKLIGKIFIIPIRIYQWVISPLLPNACRHIPTCSVYAVEAIQEWGPLRGIWMGLKRIGRCNPWGTSGYDPVPLRNACKCKDENCDQHPDHEKQN